MKLTQKIYIFWHIYIDFEKPDLGTSIVERQFELMQSSGLLDACTRVYIGYVSILPFSFTFIEHPKVEIIRHETFGQEGVTSCALKEYCDASEENLNIMYLHNRGGSRENNPASEDWTRMMEFFVIERWKYAMSTLESHFTCGCEMYSMQNRLTSESVYHYSGNFWWSQSAYIKQLPCPSFEDRYNQSELWILQPAGKTIDESHFAVLHRTSPLKYKPGRVDIYVDRYPRKFYANGSELPEFPLTTTEFTYAIWNCDDKHLLDSAVQRARQAHVLRLDASKMNCQKGYMHMVQLGWYYGVTHSYEESMYWFQNAERVAFRFDTSNQWSLYQRLLVPMIASSETEEYCTIKKLLSNLDDMLTNIHFRCIQNPLIFDRSFFYAYLDVNPKTVLEKYANLQMKVFPQIVRQEKVPNRIQLPQPPQRIRIGIVSKSLLPQERVLGRTIHASSISTSFYGTFLGLDPLKFDVRFIYVGKSASVQVDSGHLLLPEIKTLEEIRLAQHHISQMNLHILVYIDVHIHTMLNYLMFSRLATVQVCTHGHPVTSGMPRDLIDYYVSWEAAEIPNAQAHYTEKLVLIPKDVVWEYYVPRNTQLNVSELTGIAWGTVTRDDLKRELSHSLDISKRWYFCAQASFKYHHSFICAVKEILDRDPNGIFIMITVPRELFSCETRLQSHFSEYSERIVVVQKMNHHTMMAMYMNCDVALDSFFFGGDTTTREALEIGTPVVTLPSRYLGGRWSYAYYTIIGITGLIAKDRDEYVQIALKTAREGSHELRADIRKRAQKLFYSKDAFAAWGHVFASMVSST